MSLSETVVHLVERLRFVVADKHARIVDLLCTMPECVEAKDMTRWEEDCGDAIWGTVPSDVNWEGLEKYDVDLYLLMRVYDLGCCNLYAAYREQHARKEYESVIAAFRAHNIPGERPSSQEDLSCW